MARSGDRKQLSPEDVLGHYQAGPKAGVFTDVITAFQLLPADAELTVHSDSELCVKTLNEWAAGWEQRGWRRKSGASTNLELVKELWWLKNAHCRVRVQWILAHDGTRWNEYADALANAYLR